MTTPYPVETEPECALEVCEFCWRTGNECCDHHIDIDQEAA